MHTLLPELVPVAASRRKTVDISTWRQDAPVAAVWGKRVNRATAIAMFLVTAGAAMAGAATAGEPQDITPQLNAYWAEVSRSVKAGDFEGYSATCHKEGVLVSGAKKSSQPLSQALARWKQGFIDTRSGKMKAAVEFRFSQRYNNEDTAHETGIFHYSTVDAAGNSTSDYIHFEALLVKKDGAWRTIMEYQKSKATPAEWKALKPD